jgi:hypothetical protein
MEHLHRHWLNGRFGWGRRVVKIHTDGPTWRVEAIEGSGDSARVRTWTPPTEEDCLLLADELMSDEGETWREIRSSRPLP